MTTTMEESDMNLDDEAMNKIDLRIAILSRGPRLYSTRRLVEEAKKREGIDLNAVQNELLTVANIQNKIMDASKNNKHV